MRFVKDLKTGLDRGTRRFLKNMVILYASDMLRLTRTVYAKIKLDVTEDSIIDDFKYILENSANIFTTRCTQNLNGSIAKISYVKDMVRRHVIPIINHVASVYRNRLDALDTVNVLNQNYNSENAPRFFYSNRVTEFDQIFKQIERKIFTLIVYIKS